jgi:hypothetical protein
MSTILVAEGWDWAIYADPCDCPKWIVAGVKTCEPYPCYCEQTRANAPDFVIEPQCWWRKRGTGRLASRCPCWGRKTHPGLPVDCCGRHEANPQYVVPDLTGTWMADVADLSEIGLRELAPRDAPTTSSASANTEQDAGPQAYPMPERRWRPDEITCPCETPWDKQKTPGGYHCVGCHTNWVNVATAMPHQRSILHPCRPPQSFVDVDTGRRMLYARNVKGFEVWAFAW